MTSAHNLGSPGAPTAQGPVQAARRPANAPDSGEQEVASLMQSHRKDFPILQTTVRGRPLVYLDNAATTQKPRAVIDAVERYYSSENSNIHRGVHFLSQRATDAYERSRKTVQSFLGAAHPEEIIFCRGTTEAINLVANTHGRTTLGPGDEVLITAMEHHSNIVPWQMICEQTGARLRVAPIDRDGDVLLEEYERLLSDRTRIASIVHISNALGTVNPVRQMIRMAHERGSLVLLDGAQAVAHSTVDVRDLECDFYAFSGHKLFGPTGVGVLYGRRELLDSMPPYQGGGDMIASVTFEKTTYNKLPHKFEAGTPNIAGVIGLGAAIDYLEAIGLAAIERHERDLLLTATEKVQAVGGVRLVGTARQRASILSFVFDDAHPHDIGTILDQDGIAVRAGHHCAQPVMDFFGVPATVRASFSFYNTTDEIDVLVEGLTKVRELFG